MISLTSSPSSPRYRALMLAALVFVAEIALIGIVFKHGIDFTCQDNWPRRVCSTASRTMVAIYCMLGATLLLGMLNPRPLRDLVAHAGERSWPLAINLAGVALALVPIGFLREGAGQAVILPAFMFWSAGMALLLAGLGLYLAPAGRWVHFLRTNGGQVLPVLATGALTPWIATQFRPLWRFETLSNMTFEGVVRLLRGLGYDPTVHEDDQVIGMNDFFVDIAPACSGVEGMALVTLFVSLYLVLFRKDLRFPHVLLLYPAGIAMSVALNMVRITVLLIIGIEGNPELAVGGFHSHAGWLLFTLIAVGIVVAAQSVPAFQKAPADGHTAAQPHAELHPFFRDPVVARILPFAVFMFSALLAQAFSNSPGVVYPLRALAMAAALAAFWPVYARLDWRADPVAIGAGAVIGLGWVLMPHTPADYTPAYGALTGAALLGWMVIRGLGTVLLVPIIEELFFRDYLEGKLKGLSGPIVAALITAGLFAVLHDRWVEAFLAGLVLSWVMRRSNRVGDAIIAHGVANLIVFATALATGRMHII